MRAEPVVLRVTSRYERTARQTLCTSSTHSLHTAAMSATQSGLMRLERSSPTLVMESFNVFATDDRDDDDDEEDDDDDCANNEDDDGYCARSEWHESATTTKTTKTVATVTSMTMMATTTI